jgi:molybdopterin/thiamine biosynthesis adenylyltransferase
VKQDWLLLPQQACVRIRAGGRHGEMTVAEDRDGLAAVAALAVEGSAMFPSGLSRDHHLSTSSQHKQGYWHRAHPDLHQLWRQAAARGAMVDITRVDGLLDVRLPNGGRGLYYLVTYAPAPAVHPDAQAEASPEESPEQTLPAPPPPPEFVAWLSNGTQLFPVTLDAEPAEVGPSTLEPQWPATDLADRHVLVVGVGSIGSAACRELAQAGVGQLTLVDPDRLAWHNLVRHTLEARDVGKHKVDAVAGQLARKWPALTVNPYPFDAVRHAHALRPLIDDAHLVLCAADGVAPRRVVSHLSRRAGKAAVLACVLMDGEFGEVLRLRPHADEGCLTCRRAAQVTAGAVAAEAGIDRGYGTGDPHRPMTAVGSDLHLIGSLAAKVVISTLLQGRGHGLHRLPGEQAVLRLRGGLAYLPPFHPEDAGDLRWSPAELPRSGCVTCQPAS